MMTFPTAQPPDSGAEAADTVLAAAAMVEAAAQALADLLADHGLTPDRVIPERLAAVALRAGLRELAAGQMRAPSGLPAQSVVAWLRTVASELGAAGRADAAQDVPRTAQEAAGACGRVVTPGGAVAGAGEVAAAPDPVNSPAHYRAHASGVECITITEHMSFLMGSAMKYLWRADHKGGIEDLRKARWCLDREIANRERAVETPA